MTVYYPSILSINGASSCNENQYTLRLFRVLSYKWLKGFSKNRDDVVSDHNYFEHHHKSMPGFIR